MTTIYKINDDAKTIISTIAGVPYEKTYFLTLHPYDDEESIVAERNGDTVEIKPLDYGLWFAARTEFHLFVERLNEVREDCNAIAQATVEYVSSKHAQDNASYVPVRRTIAYEFNICGQIYQVIFTRGNRLMVEIIKGAYTNPDGYLCGYGIDASSPTDEKAAEARLKAYLLKKAGVTQDE